MSRGRERVLKRRAINGEFLDCVPRYPLSDRGRECFILSTRRQFTTLVELIDFEETRNDPRASDD